MSTTWTIRSAEDLGRGVAELRRARARPRLRSQLKAVSHATGWPSSKRAGRRRSSTTFFAC